MNLTHRPDPHSTGIGDDASVERGQLAPSGIVERCTFDAPQPAASGISDDFPIEHSNLVSGTVPQTGKPVLPDSPANN
ncbi:MAG: hypothetical protein ABSH46_11185 [Bryobacteraceae bacterium]